MTPDELREKIALTLVLVAQWRGHDKFSFVDTDKAADAVMLVLAEALAGKDAELADLRERAVVLPEDMDSQIHDALNESPHLSDFEALAALGIVARLIESWRPSTGDTAGPAEQWRLDEREIDGGFAGTEYPRLWPPRQAALPEEHAEPKPGCGQCYRCLEPTFPEVGGIHYQNSFIVCAICGNKRCPHATDHDHACTGSNAGNQPGSRYQYVETAVPEHTAEPIPDLLDQVDLRCEHMVSREDCPGDWGEDRPVHGHAEQTGDQT